MTEQDETQSQILNLREVLDDQLKQIADLKIENARIQEEQRYKIKMMQDRNMRLEKYYQYQKQKRYRNAGVQIKIDGSTMVGSSERSVCQDATNVPAKSVAARSSPAKLQIDFQKSESNVTDENATPLISCDETDINKQEMNVEYEGQPIFAE